MVAAGGRALQEYVAHLTPEERAKLKPRKKRKGEMLGYRLDPYVKARVRWQAMVRAYVMAQP
jgi:hypothetical protein